MIASIDIGTSYSSMCIKGSDGKIQPVDVSTGMSMYGSKYSLPTAVFLENDGTVLVGQAAMNSRKKNPQNFRMEFKRELGSNIPICLGNEKFLPEDLYARMFYHFKECAEKLGKEKIDKVYITHPATYGKKKVEKITSAANKASFFNVEPIDEPTAAAMSYIVNGNLGKNQKIMVYDFGGGTFDVCLINYDGKSFEKISEPDGLEHCGGIDFDRVIFNDIKSNNAVKEFLNEIKASPINYLKYEGQLAEMAVKAKHHLSSADSFSDEIAVGLFDTETYTLTRERFNGMISSMIGDTVQTCRNVLESAEMKMEELSAILMVGGTSRIPLVQEMVKKFAGKVPVVVAEELELAVAMGAADYGELKKKTQPKPEPMPQQTHVQNIYEKDWVGNVLKSNFIGTEATTIVCRTKNGEQKIEINRDDIVKVSFTDDLGNMVGSDVFWDVSIADDKSVMAWFKYSEMDSKKKIHLYIGANGGINGSEACNGLFRQWTSLVEVNFNNAFHTEFAENMQFMFADCFKLEKVDLNMLDTSRVKDMSRMFQRCRALETVAMNKVKTNNVTNMKSMFEGCSSLSGIDISGFDTKNVRDMMAMFSGCKNLKRIDVSHFETQNVTDMRSMFEHCSALTELDLGNFVIGQNTNTKDIICCCDSCEKVILPKDPGSKKDDIKKGFEHNSKNAQSRSNNAAASGRTQTISSGFVNNFNNQGQNSKAPKQTRSLAEKAQDFIESNTTIQSRKGRDRFYMPSNYIKGRFGIGQSERVYLFYDDSVLMTGGSGFAITNIGIYQKLGFCAPDYIDWNTFAKAKLSHSSSGLQTIIPNLGELVISMTDDTSAICYFKNEFLTELQQYLLKD